MTIREVLELCSKGKAEDLVLPVKCIDCIHKDDEILREGKLFCYITGTIVPDDGYCYLGHEEEPSNRTGKYVKDGDHVNDKVRLEEPCPITDKDIKVAEPIYEAVRLAVKSLATDIDALNDSQIDEPVSVEKYKVRGEWVEKQVVYNCNIEAWQSARCPSCKKYLTTPFNYTFYDFNFCPSCGNRLGKGSSAIEKE